MTTYTRPLVNGTPTTGQVVKAAHVNEPIDQIYDTILAGGITSDQIAAGAVDTTELATAAVTRAKMDGTIPDGSTTATNTAPTDEKGLANKKYVDDQVPTSGFFTAATDEFNVTVGVGSTFEDLDISSSVGANVALVFFQIESQVDDVKIKPKGEGGAYSAHPLGEGVSFNLSGSAPSEFVYGTVTTDSSGIIQVAAFTTSQFTLKVLGYIK
ncbi:hypothetical protein LCGC14_1142030 [marine sediment metagenome]|uniref:Tail fiber protein n=1 Tax=marine sediment metagenome TaxID=412755 RepID=A0A0F9LY06_9ZZZZ